MQLRWRSWTHKTFDEIRWDLLAKPSLLCSLRKVKDGERYDGKVLEETRYQQEQAQDQVVRQTCYSVVIIVGKGREVK